jgi:putative transcriptional regulator
MNAKEIKQMRQKLGLSQQKFATELGVGIASVFRWESGRSEPSPLALEKLRELYRKIVKMNSLVEESHD